MKDTETLDALAVKELCDIGSGKKPGAEAEIGGQQELTNEQRKRLPYIMAIWQHCFTCGAEPPPAGMYTWVIEGKTVITPICKQCSMQVDIKDKIEKGLQYSWMKKS